MKNIIEFIKFWWMEKQMKIFVGEIPSNPYLKIHYGSVARLKGVAFGEGQQSILSQMRDIDLNMAWLDYSNYLRRPNRIASEDKLFSRWLEEQYIKEVKP